MKAFNYLLFFLLLFSNGILFSQNLENSEQELVELLDNLRNAKDNNEKKQANTLFKEKLEQTIQYTGAFDYPFAKLKTLGSIKSPDNTFRFFNWNVEQDDLTQKYYCYILKLNDRTKEYNLIELKDKSFMLPRRPSDILEGDSWYGALYYKIIPFKKGSKDVYTVLGWIGNNSASTMKVIDVLTFSGKTVRLGSPVFKNGKEIQKRVFFEFSKKTSMYLSYEEKYNRIIFDHLSPETPALKGMYSMYVPDLSFDAYVFENGKWVLREDVIGVNDKGPESYTVEVKDEKTGAIKEIKVKNKWEEPSKTHVATTPEDQMREESSQKAKDDKEMNKKISSKNTPQSYNPVNSAKLKKKRRK
ncbi:MAG: hypothetical protein M9916_07810 [Crocinitomicaceae bacterium]|nr:hypothetical protein [Crocinitomicaceae bacterium]